MKKKTDRTNKNTGGTGFNFARALHALDQLGSAISKNIQPSQENAQKIKDELDTYGRQSDAFSGKDLSEKQKSELKGVREKHREALKDIRRQLPRLIEAQQKQEEKIKAAFQKQENEVQQAAIQKRELFKQLRAATKDFLNATTNTMDEKLLVFKNIRKQLYGVLGKLPKSEERTGYFKEIEDLNEQISAHQEKVEQSLKEMRAHVQKRVKANRKKVDDLVEEHGSLLPVFFLAAPLEVQDALTKLIENKKVMAILQENEQLLALLGTDSVEEGLLQITTGKVEGALAPISQQNQIAALETLLDVLSQDESLTPQHLTLARQFLETVVALTKGAQALQNGDTEYLTLLTQKDGFVFVLNVNRHDLFKPETLGNIFSAFIEQGVTQQLHVQFTTRKEAATLAVIMNNVDVKALTDRMGSLSREELLSLTQGGMSGALVKGSQGELATLPQIKTLPQITALIAGSPDIGALARVLGTTSPKLEQQLTQVMSQLDTRYPHQPSMPIPQNTFVIMKELLTMAFTARNISNILSLPIGNPKRGAIGDFVASSFYPSLPLGNTVMLMDSQLDPVGSQLMLGMVPTSLQLNGPVNGPEQLAPLVIMPQPIVQNEVLVFNQIKVLEQQLHLAQQALSETHERFALEKDKLKHQLAQKLVEVAGLHSEQKKLLEKEISELKVQVSSLTSTSQETIATLEKQIQRLTIEHRKEAKEQLRTMKEALKETTDKYDAEKMDLQRQLEENLKNQKRMSSEFDAEKLDLQRQLEENLKNQKRMASEFDAEQLDLQRRLEESQKTLKEMAIEFNAEQTNLEHQSKENLKAVTDRYNKDLQELEEENTHLNHQLFKLGSESQERISHLEAQLQLATVAFEFLLRQQQQMAEEALHKAHSEKELLQQKLEESLDAREHAAEDTEELQQLLASSDERVRQLERQLQRTDRAYRRDFEQQQLFIEELLNAQEKPENTLDLSVQAAQYEAFLEEFEQICNVLQVKEAADSIYSDATDAAEDAYQILHEVGEEFFANPTPETFANFKAICKESMTAAASELSQHRDIWPSIHPIFRGILGIIATLTVIPALLVAGLSKQGYLGSFFRTTEPESAKDLSRAQSQFKTIEDAIDQNMQMAF